MSLLPGRIPNDVGWTGRSLTQASRAQQKAELTVFQHALGARVRAECDRIDSQSAADALRSAFDEEVGLYDYGIQRVNGSAAKAQLLARKVEMLARINNTRVSRRFGG
jgi:hypothetical protein